MSRGARRSLITGGAGFVGATLARRLVDAGDRVAVLDDLSTGSTAALADADVHLFRADIRDTEAVADAIRTFRPDIVFHLAALHYIPDCIADRARTWALNVTGTRSVLAACATQRVDRVVFASSAAVYAPSPEPCSEHSPLGALEIYGETKIVGERLVAAFCRRTGADGLVVRLFNVYGPGDTTPHVIPAIVEQAARSTTLTLGALEPKRDFVHVDDVAEAMIRLTSRELHGFHVVNIGSGREVSVADVVAMVADIVGAPIDVTSAAELQRPVERMHLLADVRRLAELVHWRPNRRLEDRLGPLLLASSARVATEP